jgi:hypothetical protein
MLDGQVEGIEFRVTNGVIERPEISRKLALIRFSKIKLTTFLTKEI